MHFEPGNLYHVYNQGNNRQPIFFSRENYLYFLRKMRKQLMPVSGILAYCLMPNHFHFLLYVKKVEDTHPITSSDQMSQHLLVNKIATLLRSYTRAINNQENRSGSLFRQKTKAVEIDSIRYGITCMHYIHQNPLKANLVDRLGQWEFSSFPDYAGIRNGTLINKNRAKEILRLDLENFVQDSNQMLNHRLVQKII